CGGSIGWRSAGALASAFISGAHSANGEGGRLDQRHPVRLKQSSPRRRRSLQANERLGSEGLKLDEESSLGDERVRWEARIEQTRRLLRASDREASLVDRADLSEHASLIPIDALEGNLLILCQSRPPRQTGSSLCASSASPQAGELECRSHG